MCRDGGVREEVLVEPLEIDATEKDIEGAGISSATASELEYSELSAVARGVTSEFRGRIHHHCAIGSGSASERVREGCA
jgi:hypothetical protein